MSLAVATVAAMILSALTILFLHTRVLPSASAYPTGLFGGRLIVFGDSLSDDERMSQNLIVQQRTDRPLRRCVHRDKRIMACGSCLLWSPLQVRGCQFTGTLRSNPSTCGTVMDRCGRNMSAVTFPDTRIMQLAVRQVIIRQYKAIP